MNPLEALVVWAAVVTMNPDKPEIQYNESATCLAKNMYYEARNQGTAGWMAVTAVVLNRVNDDRFPNTICEVQLVNHGKTQPLTFLLNIFVSSHGFVMGYLITLKTKLLIKNF